MLTKLRLERFKNFQDAELQLGPFTVLVGANASGKSNLRDALRFLHAISRGYTLGEILGEKWVEGGVLQWRGIRGGTREVAFLGESRFSVEASFVMQYKQKPTPAHYRITVEVRGGMQPRVVAEGLRLAKKRTSVFDAYLDGRSRPGEITVEMALGGQQRTRSFSYKQPVISQLAYEVGMPQSFAAVAIKALEALGSWRFHDLDLDAMRQPSAPGQELLGDRGENLSSVLLALCEDENRRRTLVQWLRALTPMDAGDLDFYTDAAGRVLVRIIESNGHPISAYSASDGTLRFLALLAALLGPKPAELYVFDEVETGIHPTRLHLLVQLIEEQTRTRGIQVVVTTHSPQLLGFLSPASRANASLVYRLPEQPDAHICRILDIPEAARLLEKGELARLHASGWMENAMFFLQGEGDAE